jgi:hypothetical protein
MSPMKKMPGKRVQFDEETCETIEAVVRDSGSSFQELTDEAFANLLKKHKQPDSAFCRAIVRLSATSPQIS